MTKGERELRSSGITMREGKKMRKGWQTKGVKRRLEIREGEKVTKRI